MGKSGDDMSAKKEQCVETYVAFEKMGNKTKSDMDELDKHLTEMGTILEKSSRKFKHNAKSVLLVEGLDGQCERSKAVLNSASGQRMSVDVKQVAGKDGEESFQLLNKVTSEACKHGARVVVWFRRKDITTTDPDDGQGETAMLTELNEHPHIVHLHVLVPEHLDSDVDSMNWSSHAPDLEITYHSVTQFKNNPRAKWQEIDDSTKAAEGKADEKKREQEKRFEKSYKDFQSKSKDIIQQQAKILSLTAKEFHQKTVMQGDLRKTMQEGLNSLSKYTQDISDEKVPDEKFLKASFLCQVAAHGETEKGKVWAGSFNEFEARVFVLQVMLGQTIARAKKLAEKVYDETIDKVMNKLAQLFSLGDEQLREKIEEYIEKTPPPCSESVTYGFTQRTNFVHMYVGVVASIAVPLLCCTILPILIDGSDISTEHYKKACEEATRDLRSSVAGPGPCCCLIQ